MFAGTRAGGGGRRLAALVAGTVVVGLLAATLVATLGSVLGAPSAPASTRRSAQSPGAATVEPVALTVQQAPSARALPPLPFGAGPIFPGHRLVAYYGTAGTASMGVLGEDTPDRITKRLRRAAAPFATRRRPVQIAYELIVTVADRSAGSDGDFSHDIARDKVRPYIRAAHRHKALLIVDLQPGRSGFLTVARRWAWALRDPWVGLALDPEWRMGPRQVPGKVIGSVGAREVNRVSRWLRLLQVRHGLPEKVFMLHTFRTTMIRNIDDVVRRRGLAMVQHVDGFGTPRQKLATYHTVARPRRFHMGFKLFYDEDRPRMSADRVRKIRPVVEYVSFQ